MIDWNKLVFVLHIFVPTYCGLKCTNQLPPPPKKKMHLRRDTEQRYPESHTVCGSGWHFTQRKGTQVWCFWLPHVSFRASASRQGWLENSPLQAGMKISVPNCVINFLFEWSSVIHERRRERREQHAEVLTFCVCGEIKQTKISLCVGKFFGNGKTMQMPL